MPKKKNTSRSKKIKASSVESPSVAPLFSKSATNRLSTATSTSTTTRTTLIIVIAASFVFIASLAAVFAGGLAKKQQKPVAPTTNQNKNVNGNWASKIAQFKDCDVFVDATYEDIDPATWEAIFSEVQSGNYTALQDVLLTKMQEFSQKAKQYKNDPAAMRQLDIRLSQCMVSVVQSLDKIVVELWKTVDGYDRDENTALYVDGLSDADMKRALEQVHQKLVDRAITEKDTNKHTTPEVNSYEEMYLQLIVELQAIQDFSQHPNDMDYFPYKFAIVSSDLFMRAIPFDFGWEVDAATAYTSLPLLDPFLKNTQFFSDTLNSAFHDPENGDIQQKQQHYAYNRHNIPYGVNTLEFARKQVGSFVDYEELKRSGVPTSGTTDTYEVSVELGGARYERCDSILYDRYIVQTQTKYQPIAYTTVTSEAQRMYQEMKDKKQVVQSLYFIQALMYIYTSNVDPETGQIPEENYDEFAAQVIALATVYKTKNPVLIAMYLNMLFGYEYGDEEYVMPSKMVKNFVNVISAFLGPDVAKEVQNMLTDALSDGILTTAEMQAIAEYIINAAKNSSPIVAAAQVYRDQLRSVIEGPYVDNRAGLGDYNACKFEGVKVIFSGDQPGYLPPTSKYQSRPIVLIRKSTTDILISRQALAPILKSHAADTVVAAAASKKEDLQAIMDIAAAVTLAYLEDNAVIENGQFNEEFFPGLIEALYTTFSYSQYDTPVLKALYQVKVEGKTLKQIAQQRLDSTEVDDYATSLVNHLLDFLASQGYDIP